MKKMNIFILWNEIVSMKKGFTLIELLAVIFLLGAIATIVSIAILSILNTSREDLYQEQINTIEKAAKNYQLANPSATEVSLKVLAKDGYLDSADLEDPRDRSQLCGYVKITYKESNHQYYFEFVEENC